jgi:hypothetical protein
LWAGRFASSLLVRPMNSSDLARTVLWLVPLALQCVIVVVMSYRGLARRFPVFFCYSLLLPARDLLLLYLSYPSPAYARIFWWGEGWALLLSLGVIVETIRHLIEPYPFLRTVFGIFWIGCIVAGAAALAMLLWNNGPSGADLALEWIILTERSARFLQVCLLIAVVFLISRLGLTWYDFSVGIAAGFGTYAALDLSLLEVRASFHIFSEAAFVLLRSAAYNLAVGIWAFYFFRPRRVHLIERLPGHDLANWNDALTEHVDKWYPH